MQDRRDIVALRESGSTITVLAKRYSVSDYSIRVVLAEAGHREVRRKYTPGQIHTICALFDEGHSVMEISRRTGIPDSTARLVLRQHGRR
ncbi:hypothetical protein GCM10027579_28450 [Calidifontibacter terrae]